MVKKILIAEDELNMMRLITYNLGKPGHQLLVANDGIEAKKLLKKGLSDLMISDLIMPRLDGFTLLEWVKVNSALRKYPSSSSPL
jgi:DNA-binding response OmpR family regulator